MLKTELLYDPAIPLLGIYLEKALTHNNTSSLFMAPRFCNSQHLKASYMSSTDEWLKKMQYIYTMEYYSAMKKNEVMSFATAWIDLETVTVRAISQTEKDKYDDITYMQNLKR